MKKQFVRIVCGLVACGLLLVFSFVAGNTTAYSAVWDDSDFFQAQADCDNNSYNTTLENCRNTPGYPSNPTESDCRAQAALSFGDCLDGIPSPTYSLDFCSMARARRDACANIYGSNAQPTPDWPAYGECYDASGVSQCE